MIRRFVKTGTRETHTEYSLVRTFCTSYAHARRSERSASAIYVDLVVGSLPPIHESASGLLDAAGLLDAWFHSWKSHSLVTSGCFDILDAGEDGR
jgi:hypothetical protein